MCKVRLEAPVPKPLSFDDDPAQDEMWPEPAQVLGGGGSQDQPETFDLIPETNRPTVPANIQAEENESIGTYNLAFEPESPKLAGIARSAEWDQGKPASTPPVSGTAVSMPPEPIKAVQLAPEVIPVAGTYQTEIDPLFGDEVKVPVAVPKQTVAAPLAKLAPQESELSTAGMPPDVKLEPELPLPANDEQVLKKKKKKKTEEPACAPESFAHLDKPTEETHLYRLSMAEENRIKPDAPPTLLFVDGVLNFPFQLKNLPPFIWLTLYFAFNFSILRLIQYVLDTPSMFSAVGAGALGMALFMSAIFTLAYACACWSSTIIYTSAGSHAVDWGTDGWKENVVIFLRIGYYFVLAMMMATPMLVFNGLGIGYYLWMMATLFIFPIFLFSGLASLTFWNFLHGEVIKKTIAKGHYYLTMYLLSLVIFAMTGGAVYFTMSYLVVVLISAPLAAAAWLIYGRLLGRMAWLLQQEPKRKKKKKKKKKVEGESSQEADSIEEAEEESELVASNEKGPREDARGPGGARPV
ncbi:MAG: hypothetical protein U0796_20065 [Gemmatales bacterium]